MPKCSYCGDEYDLHKGVTLVGKDGTVYTLCSSKCRKNRKMKRRKVRWVTKAKKVASLDVPQTADLGGKDVVKEIEKEKVEVKAEVKAPLGVPESTELEGKEVKEEKKE